MSSQSRFSASQLLKLTRRMLCGSSGGVSFGFGTYLCLVGPFLLKDLYPHPPSREAPVFFGAGFCLFGMLLIHFATRDRNGR
jgi:hypothetical protein